MKKIALLMAMCLATPALAQQPPVDKPLTRTAKLNEPIKAGDLDLKVKSVDRYDVGSPSQTLLIINMFTTGRGRLAPVTLVSPDGEVYEPLAPKAAPTPTTDAPVAVGEEVSANVAFAVAPSELNRPNWFLMVGDPTTGVKVLIQ